jgi:hypothetical protein
VSLAPPRSRTVVSLEELDRRFLEEAPERELAAVSRHVRSGDLQRLLLDR